MFASIFFDFLHPYSIRIMAYQSSHFPAGRMRMFWPCSVSFDPITHPNRLAFDPVRQTRRRSGVSDAFAT
jgi:hypothetical protein